jgi:hypothetical protein
MTSMEAPIEERAVHLDESLIGGRTDLWSCLIAELRGTQGSGRLLERSSWILDRKLVYDRICSRDISKMIRVIDVEEEGKKGK